MARPYSFLRLCCLAAVLGPLLSGVAGARTLDPAQCVDCHEEAGSKMTAGSVHEDLECVDCHVKGPFGEHDDDVPKASCAECHEDLTALYAKSVHSVTAKPDTADLPTCGGCHGDPHKIKGSDAPEAAHNRKQIPLMCARCHADTGVVKRHDIPVADPQMLYNQGVHGKAQAEGNDQAAVCSDCHGAHSILPGWNMNSQAAKQHVSESCGKCHETIFDDFKISVHGSAVLKGISDAPACTDCHGEHAIQNPRSEGAATSKVEVATKTCAHCHEDLTLTQRFGLPGQRLASYLSSYHGLAMRGGFSTVANCSSCHGVHRILPSADPRSSIHPDRLAETCSQCHPNASEAFAKTPVHLITSEKDTPIIFWVRYFYIWLIVLTIGGMLGHNAVIYLSAVMQKLRRERASRRYRRFTTPQLILHGMLLSSFITLAISGFALKFPESGWTVVLKWTGVDEIVRRVVHRIAAVVMLTAGMGHVIYAAFTRHGRYDWLQLAPRLSDLREVLQTVVYHIRTVLGRPAVAPTYDRYNYIHKAEYWAVIWGTMIMGVTGFALWFPDAFSQFLPAWGIPLMEVVHYYEAWLATLAIVVWHFFFVIFHPHAYPMETTWLTGRVAEEEMRTQHGRELEKIKAGEERDEPIVPNE